MQAKNDEGMTLIELLIAVAILALVVGPIVIVLEYAMATAKASSQRTTDSSGAQLMSSYLVTDVQSADFVWAWTSGQQTPTGSPFGADCGDTNTRLEIQSQDPVKSGPTSATFSAVTYDVVPPTGAGDADTAFVRHTWTVGATGCTQTGSTSLIEALDSNNLPTATCEPTSSACSSATTDVDLTVVAFTQNVHNSNLYGKYTYNLTASRRTG